MSHNLLEYFWDYERKSTENRIKNNSSAIKTMLSLLLRSIRDAAEWAANYKNITGCDAAEHTKSSESYRDILEKTKLMAETYDSIAQNLNDILNGKPCPEIDNFTSKDINMRNKTISNINLHDNNAISFPDDVSATTLSEEDLFNDEFNKDIIEMHRHMDRRREEYYKTEAQNTAALSETRTPKSAPVASPLDQTQEVASILRRMPVNELEYVLEDFYYKSLAKAKESFGKVEVDKKELENLAAKYADEMLVEYCMKKNSK